MAYLNCPDCRLTVYRPLSYGSEECPRCRARLGKASPLFRSSVPARLLERRQASGERLPRADSPRQPA